MDGRLTTDMIKKAVDMAKKSDITQYVVVKDGVEYIDLRRVFNT